MHLERMTTNSPVGRVESETTIFLFHERPVEAAMLELSSLPYQFIPLNLYDYPDLDHGIILIDCDQNVSEVIGLVCYHYTLPVIALVHTADAETALKAGAWDYLVTGQVTPELFERTLRHVQSRQALTRQVDTLSRAHARTVMRFANLIDRNQDGILVINGEGLIQYVNPAGEELFGRDLHRLAGSPLGFLVTSGEVTEMEILQKSGQVATVEIRVMDIEWDGEEAQLLSLRDITIRRAAEAALLEREKLLVALEKEKEMTRIRNHFMTTISHEFRTPLSIIQSASDLLTHYFDRLTQEKRQQRLDTISAQVKHLEVMLDEISIIVYAEMGKLTFQPAVLDIRQFCQRIVDDVTQTVGLNHHIEFRTGPDPDWSIPGDPKLLMHIINNLLSNAIKYSEAGKRIQFDLKREANMIVIRIQDEGIGIPAADQQRLLEVFQRGSNVGKISGTGLGLKVVKDCVALHGGTFKIESTEGVGTTCTVRIPA